MIYSKKMDKDTAHLDAKEGVSTEGDFSPGVVDKNYSLKLKSIKTKTRKNTPVDTSDKQSNTLIETKGDYSPGRVGGDYKIEER